MDSLLFYWVLTLVVLIGLIMIIGVESASVIVVFIILLKFITQHNKKDIEVKVPINVIDQEKIPIDNAETKMMTDNAETLDNILYPNIRSADDMIADSSITNGMKDKKAKEIRSHWNSDKWKKYYEYELNIHDQKHRDWWTDDDFELSAKHVVI